MNRLSIMLVLWCACCVMGQSQDLIQNTLNGTSYTKRDAVANRTFELIESRKISDGRFVEKSPFEYQKVPASMNYKNYVSEAVFLTLNPEYFQQIRTGQQDISLEIPVSSTRSFELELTRVNITSTEFDIQTASGKNSLGDLGVFYRGIVKGDPHSFAAISIFGDHIRGLIGDDGGNYVLSKSKQKKGEYVLYNDKKLLIDHNWVCETPDEDMIVPEIEEPVSNRSMAGSCVDVYVETELALMNSLGGIGATAHYVLALFNESSILYFNEGINIQLARIHIWDIADPYSGGSTACGLRSVFQANRPSFPGYVGQLLTSRSIGGGCAYGARFCDEHTYAVSGSMGSFSTFPTYSWEVMVFTHEMGHQLGSPHTHACRWNGNNTQIDDCGNIITSGDQDGVDQGCFVLNQDTPIIPASGGTIMSYCHTNSVGINFNLGFGSQPAARIRGVIDAASCFSFDCDCTNYVNRSMNVTNYSLSFYEASNSILAQGGVDRPDYQPVVFRAGNFIQLTNFHAQSGSTFIAQAGGEVCDYNAFYEDDSSERMGLLEVENASELLIGQQAKVQPLQIYPVPFTDEVTIEFNLEQNDAVYIDIINVSGQRVAKVQTQKLMNAGAHKITYNGRALLPGVYQIRFQTSQGIRVQKLIKAQ